MLTNAELSSISGFFKKGLDAFHDIIDQVLTHPLKLALADHFFAIPLDRLHYNRFHYKLPNLNCHRIMCRNSIQTRDMQIQSIRSQAYSPWNSKVLLCT